MELKDINSNDKFRLKEGGIKLMEMVYHSLEAQSVKIRPVGSKGLEDMIEVSHYTEVEVEEPKIKVTSIAPKENPEEQIAWLIGEQKELEAKVLNWYVKTKDEEYREYMDIIKRTIGKI